MAAPPSPARACAYAVTRRVFEQGAYADRALHGAARGLDPRERALATALAFGTVQRRETLDHIAAGLVDRPLGRLEPAVRDGLRLGLFQLLFMDGVADHAAVSQTVALVKPLSPAGAGLLNAVLRRAAREGPALLAGLHDRTPEAAAVLHSVPAWLARRWWQELGAPQARALLGRVNRPAEPALRANTLLAGAREVAGRLPVPTHPALGLAEGLVLEAAFDAHGSQLWREGAIMPQSRGSMLVARALAPAAGQSVLDLCAAPGGKTTHLAALGAGRVVAVERHPGRARALAATAQRMRAPAVEVVVADAADAGGPAAPAALRAPTAYDAVLVDPPCSGLGTLQSRPDLRWHASEEGIVGLAGLQAQILAAGARLLKPGGVLVYSVCTISRAEGEGVIADFLAAHPAFQPDDLSARLPAYADAAVGPYLQLLPHREGTDGFFVARLIRGPG